MSTNLDRYKDDLDKLVEWGSRLAAAIKKECFPEKLLAAYKKAKPKDGENLFKKIPSFKRSYQGWYSEAKAIIKQLLPDRLDDFVRHYETPKSRKSISYESYRIEDYLQSLAVTKRILGEDVEMVVGPDAGSVLNLV